MPVQLLNEIARAAQNAAQQVQSAEATIREGVDAIDRENVRLEELAARRAELFEQILAPTDFEDVVDQLHHQDAELRRRAQLIRQGVQEEALRTEELLELLGNVQTQVARQIEQIFELVRLQQLTADQGIRELEKIRRSLGPDNITGAVAAGLESELRRAQRDGTI